MQGNHKINKLYIRFSTIDDVENIFDFYLSNRHEHVAIRDKTLMKAMIKSGSVTIIEDKNGKIHASSISYPISKQGKDNHEWTEIGSTRITLSGLGLFKTLISAQVLHAYIFEPPEDRIVLEIDRDNERSKQVFKKIGAEEFQAPKEIGEAANNTMAPEDRTDEVDWFQFKLSKMEIFAKNILASMEDDYLIQKNTGIRYKLDFSRMKINKQVIELIAKKPHQNNQQRIINNKFKK